MRKKTNKKLTGVSTVVLLVRRLAKGRSPSNGPVAQLAELGVVVARLQNGGGDLAAALVENAVVTATKLSAVPFLDGLDVGGAARRRARPVGVPLLYDSAGLDQARPRLRGLALVGGNFGELG